MPYSFKHLIRNAACLIAGTLIYHTGIAQISFNLPANAPGTDITALEYFYDQDPGSGNGTALPVTSGRTLTGNYTADLSSLTRGVHRLYVRARNASGQWGATTSTLFVLYKPFTSFPATDLSTSDIVKAEYFVDTDPGMGRGTDIPLTSGTNLQVNNIAVNVTGLSMGIHNIYIRLQNAAGIWSQATINKFTFIFNSINRLPAHPAIKPITRLEYFFDTDPGFGNGQPLTVTATNELSNFTFAADLTGYSIGQHTLYVRSLDGLSITHATPLTIGSGGPLPLKWRSFEAMQEGKTALLKWRTADEKNNHFYTIERSINGRDFKVIGKLDASQTEEKEHSYSFTDNAPASGTNYYRLKQTDLDDRFTYSPVIPLFMNAVSSGVTINNPVQQTLIVNSNSTNNRPVKAWITNQAGNRVLQTELNAHTQYIDVSNLQPGIYFLNLEGTDMADALRFVKQ